LPKRANDIIALDVGIIGPIILNLRFLENMSWEKIREDNVLQISLILAHERLQVETIDQKKIYISGSQFGEFTIFDPSKITKKSLISFKSQQNS